VKKKSFVYDLVIGVLRVALVVALVAAGWKIYERLPAGPSPEQEAAAGVTELQIVLRPSPRDNGAAVNIPVQLYPIDLSAAQREYGFEPRPGVRLDDFLKERMQGRSPVSAHLDEHGQAVVMLTPGRWWVYAVLSGTQNVEWQLPINVSGRQQTVELNTGNIYARTKSF
jgi:hypothetical protein